MTKAAGRSSGGRSDLGSKTKAGIQMEIPCMRIRRWSPDLPPLRTSTILRILFVILPMLTFILLTATMPILAIALSLVREASE